MLGLKGLRNGSGKLFAPRQRWCWAYLAGQHFRFLSRLAVRQKLFEDKPCPKTAEVANRAPHHEVPQGVVVQDLISDAPNEHLQSSMGSLMRLNHA